MIDVNPAAMHIITAVIVRLNLNLFPKITVVRVNTTAAG